MSDISDLIQRLEYRLRFKTADGAACVIATDMLQETIELLRKQVPRELTKTEWETWKKTKNRDPICMIWEGDTTPIWALNPEEIHEPAYLMGQLRLFNGRPCRE